MYIYPNSTLYLDGVDEFTSKIGVALGLIKPRKVPLNKVVSVDVFLDLNSFPSAETGTLPNGFSPAANHQEKLFAMMQMIFGTESVSNSTSFEEFDVDSRTDVPVDSFHKRLVKKIEFNGFIINGVGLNIHGRQRRAINNTASISSSDIGHRSNWTFEINPACLDSSDVLAMSVSIRDTLVLYFESVNECLSNDVKEKEKNNSRRYTFCDGT